MSRRGPTRVALHSYRGKCRQDVFDLRAQELRRSAQGVTVLSELPSVIFDSAIFFLAGGKAGAGQHLENVGGYLNLARVRTRYCVNEWCEGALRAEHSFRSHSRAHLR